MDKSIPRLLTIAGSDSSGGAGIQADLKTFQALKCYGMSATTAVTAQNTLGVLHVEPLPVSVVAKQIQAVFSDIGVDAVKIGMLFSSEIVEAVFDAIRLMRIPAIVLDPVMVATSGDQLLCGPAVQALKDLLLPLASVVTPNIPEAEILSAMPIQNNGDMEIAAAIIVENCQAVLIKGGHSTHDESASDYLMTAEGTGCWIRRPRILTENTHGTGCTLSAATAVFLARGSPLLEAVDQARDFVQMALTSAQYWKLGHGPGPLCHWA